MPRRRPPQAKPTRGRPDGAAMPVRGPPRGRDDFLIVGLGDSAGGLDACRKLVESLPASNGMAFIFVQHLDPTHESMMVELLANHTVMRVLQAADGMPLERDHLYVIPPGTYLSAGSGALHLSEPQARHGARLPFDFLLRSLAEEYGERVVCVILSGTAADGSLGLKAVKEKGGLVIAQDPDEAAYDGMPRNAILTGAVDLVLPVAKISDALVKYDRRMVLTRTQNCLSSPDAAQDCCPRSLIFCAQGPVMTSGSTNRGRCSAGSSGAWRWRRSRSTTRIAISRFSGVTQGSSTFLPRICSSMSPASPVIRRCSTSW